MTVQWPCIVLSFVTIFGSLRAQQPAITSDTIVSTETLHQWLHSGDPRLVAWAADIARRTHDAKAVAEMPALIEQGVGQGYFSYGYQSNPMRATLAVLDTLIQENAQVPSSTIQAIANDFPAQAIILIRRLPLAESRNALGYWSNEDSGFRSARILARVAAMMLARDPEPAFVARFVTASEEVLQVSVVASGGIGGMSSGTSCGDSLSRMPSPDWPVVYAYALAENDSHGDASPVLDLDGDRITSRRLDESKGYGSCSGIAPLNAETRHRLIAHWLGVPPDAMLWHPTENESIVWTDQAAYESQLGAIVELHRKQLFATVEALHQRGLLSDDQAASVAPRLVVTVRCLIKPCPLAS